MIIATYEDDSGAAPADSRFFALAPDVYDGAADAGTLAACCGQGATPEAAIADYWERYEAIIQARLARARREGE